MVQTVADPGQISVPMSSILDALEGILTEAERTQLFEALIGLRPSGVAPGDLITAELFNQILSDLNDLAQRVAVLEGSSDNIPRQPIIDQIVPMVVKTGQEFTVFGKNLTPKLLSRIDVDETNIPLKNIKDGSSPTRLVLVAPPVLGLPPGGTTVVLTVANPAGSGEGSYLQLPGVSTENNIKASFLLKSVTPLEGLISGKTYDFTYELELESAQEETLVLSAAIDGPNWIPTIKDGQPNIPLPSSADTDPIKIQKVIAVKIGTGTSPLKLKLKGTKFPDVGAAAQELPLSVGAVPIIPTSVIKTNDVSLVGPDIKRIDNTLYFKRIPANGTANSVLNVQLRFANIDKYKLGNPAITAAEQWTVSRTTATPLDITTPDTNGLIKFTIAPPKKNNAEYKPADGQLDFIVESSDGKEKFPFSVQLRVVDALP
jgi:hypothetical protein